ncbi:MAG: hypothetical protein EOM73_01190 [Bacteroidia bacterium]|nr:hypothetical protein [Bacteroidia bacterium]
MKKIVAIIFFAFLLSQNTKAQDRKMGTFQLSYNQVELGLEYKILSEKLFLELHAGVANQDINSNFDDFTSRLGIGYTAFSKPKNQISIHTGFGLYFTNNDYYSITVPLVYAGTRYTMLLGKTGKHRIFVNAGYRYGKRNYKEQYLSDIVNVSSIGTLKLAPLYFSIGYGFNF